jgi:hypothetical protein
MIMWQTQPLFGETVVFTGSLTLPRREAAALAASVGCEVASGVTKSTTLLVVGDQDVRKLAGNERSSKHSRDMEMTADLVRQRLEAMGVAATFCYTLSDIWLEEDGRRLSYWRWRELVPRDERHAG